MRGKRALQALASVAIVTAGLYLFLRGSHPKELLAQILSTNIFIAAICAVLAILSLVIRVLRWRIILPALPGAHQKKLFSHTIIGFMLNNVLPARIGEAARPVLLWKKNGFPLAVAVGSLVVERLLDVLCTAVFFIVPVLFLPVLSELLPAAYIAIAAMLGAIILAATYAFFPRAARQWLKAGFVVVPLRWRHRVQSMTAKASLNLHWLSQPGLVVEILVYSCLVELCYALQIYLLAGDAAGFGPLQALFAHTSAVVGCAIPLSPGFIGTLHAAMLEGLSLVHMEPDRARALTLVFHAINYLTVTLAGFVYFFKADLSFREISHAAEAIEETEVQGEN